MSIRRILVATGDIALISFLEEELDRLGYRVIGPAATGRQAVEIALKQKPDAILMDVHLRGKKTGFQAAEEIRASAGIPVIYLAAPQDAQSLQRANGGDAFLCLSRPVGERELCVGLEMALFKHAAEQRLERLNQVLRAIRKVNKIIIRLDDPRRLLEEACQILVEMRSYRLVWIGHKKRGAARLQVLASAGQGCKLLRAFFTLGSDKEAAALPCAAALRRKKPNVCQDVLADNRFAPWQAALQKHHIGSSTAIPLLYENEAHGVLCLYDDRPDAFDEEEVDLLVELAGDLAFAMEGIHQQELRLRAETTSPQTERLYRQAIQETGGIPYQRNYSDDKYTFLGEGMEELTGYTAEEMTASLFASRLRQIKSYGEFGDLPHAERVRMARQGSIKEWQEDYLFERKDGSLVWLADRSVPIYDHAGNVTGSLGILVDINKRKLVEEALNESEQRYRLLFELSPDAIVVHRAGKIVYANLAAAKLVGAASPQELIAKPIMDFVHPDYRQMAGERIQKLAEGVPIPSTDEKYLKLDGTLIDVEVVAAPIRYRDEQAFMVIVHDITERKSTEAALRESEKKYRSLFDASPESVTLLGLDGRIIECNAATVELTGLPKEELIGKHFTQLGILKAQEILKYIGLFSKMIIGKQGRYTEIAIERGGEQRRLEVFVNLLIEGEQFRAIQAIARDVTEREQVREALQNSEKRFRALIENSSDGIVLVDPRGLILYESPAYSRMTGRQAGQRLGRSGFEFVHPQDLEAVLKTFNELLRSPGGTQRAVFRHQHADGSWRWIEATADNLLGESAIQGIVVNMKDVTERNKAELAAQRHLSELEVLYENGLSISLLLEPKGIAQQMIAVLSQKLAWHHAAVRLYHPETGTVELLAFNRPGLSEAEKEAQVARLNRLISKHGQGLSGWVIAHGKAVRSGQVQKDRRYVQTYPGIQSGIYAPIQIGERTLGSIAVESELEDAFSEQDERLLAILANQAAIAFENARLYQDVLRTAERRSVLHSASQEIVAAGLDLEAVYAAIHRAASALMTVDVFTIALYDHASQEVEAVFLLDSGQRFPNMRIPLGKGLSGLVIQNRQTLRLRDHHKEMPTESVSFGKKSKSHSVLAVPMFAGDAVIGAITAQSHKTDEYNEEDQSLLEMLAAYASIAIENARLFAQTHQRAEELGALVGISSALRSSVTRAEMIPAILDQLVNSLHAEDAVLAIQDAATGENVIEQARGAWAKEAGVRLRPDQGLIGLMAETLMPYQSGDITQESGLRLLDAITQPEAVVGIPLLVQGQFIGSLWIGRRQGQGEGQPEAFTADETHLLGSIADVAASGLHRAMLHEQALHHAEQLVTVNEIGRLLGETLELDQIYGRLTDAIYSLVPDICCIFISLYDPTAQNLACVCGHFDGKFINPAELAPVQIDPGGGDCQSRVILSGQPVIANDLETRAGRIPFKELTSSSDRTSKSGLYVPMIARGQTIGLIQIQSSRSDRFGSAETNLLALVANASAIAIENAHLLAETQKRLHRLSALHSIDTAISASVDIRVTLNILLEQAARELKVDAAAVLLLNPITRTLEYAASRGFHASLVTGTQIPLGFGVAGQAALRRRLESSSELDNSAFSKADWRPATNVYEGEGFVTHHAVPLVAKGQVQGVMEVFQRSPFQPDEEWFSFLDMLAGQAAIAIDNAHLFEDLQRSNINLVTAYDATIQGWSQALELRDEETEGHTRRVTELTLRLAQLVGIPSAELEHIRRGALLHDIGKMGVPDAVLLKPGKLTEEEWTIMRRHPVYAYEMLSSIAYLRPALDIPHYHHEKWDGSGYPDGLKGEQIPLCARVFAVADVYDALTSNRPYRRAWTVEQAIAYIREQSERHFDPRIVKAFLSMIAGENGSRKTAILN